MQQAWHVLPDAPESLHTEHPELPKIVVNLLYHRNITTPDAIEEFLNPDYAIHVHDPYLFQDMSKAVDRIFAAKANNEPITIHGDYDADGVSASVILSTLFTTLGITHDVFLPHRETDGYGLNKNTVKLLADQGTKVIITCDCGISNRSEVILANELGVDVIITDHHSIPAELPPAYAIIHPKIEGEPYPDKNLAGGGVAFKLAQGILRKHAETHDTLPNSERHGAYEKWLLDMVAIASVADMVPLIGESRTLTKYGMIVLNKTRRIGMQKLLLEARLVNDDGTARRELNADTIGFQIAPRINAAGRMDHANVAYKLFMATDPTQAVDLAFALNQNNLDRQQATELMTREATDQVAAKTTDDPIIFVRGKEWSLGLVGLIASKLKEEYQRPAIAMTDGATISGSCRSIPGFNMIEAMQSMPEFFLKFGGHPMACGFTLRDPSVRPAFEAALNKKFTEVMSGHDLTPTVSIDAELTLEDIHWDLYDILEKFKPFGQANAKPKYLARGVTVTALEPVGEGAKHLRIMVKHHTPKIRKTIGWNLCSGHASGVNWCKELRVGDLIDMVFELDVNEWNGNRELQMVIVDLRKNDT